MTKPTYEELEAKNAELLNLMGMMQHGPDGIQMLRGKLEEAQKQLRLEQSKHAESSEIWDVELSRAQKQIYALREVLSDAQRRLPNVAQLLDGWHTDVAWSEFDTKCRKDVAEIQYRIEQALSSTPSRDFIHKREVAETIELFTKLVGHYFEPQTAHYRVNAELKRLESLTKQEPTQ